MNNNNPIKARLYIGGLKSLFVDIVNSLEEIENTGNVPIDLLQTLEDVKNAIDMTTNQLKRTSAGMKCCEHAPEPKEEKVCEGCGQPPNECECEFCEECGKELIHDCQCDIVVPPTSPTFPKSVPNKKSESKVINKTKKTKGK